ncbi:ribosomal RNA-processing protein 7 homolog A [Zerene cesonia]|uniref:ribosomal RNA-processing protein 7 homolog A n=1 Tax=Zerene cesonia TaxID=33412 RepID=UPI0018E5275B|nr:ribosomal RNA-processing protein 7 homolog A [Zerene cesonia]
MKAIKRNDFKALKLKYEQSSKYPHTIYFKEHSVREHTADKPSGRTLFIVNVPPYADEKGLINAFSQAGTVESVQFCSKPNATEIKKDSLLQDKYNPSFRLCYLVFNKVSELDNALKLTELQPLNSDGHTNFGIKKWFSEYNQNVMKPKDLKESIEKFMQNYDEKVKKELEEEKKLEQEDEEGWVTVTKRGKVQSFARTEKVENKIMANEEKSKKKKELKNFYTFQIRESKMKHIVSLRQKFEEDKRKIAQIKQSRRFKPF